MTTHQPPERPCGGTVLTGLGVWPCRLDEDHPDPCKPAFPAYLTQRLIDAATTPAQPGARLRLGDVLVDHPGIGLIAYPDEPAARAAAGTAATVYRLVDADQWDARTEERQRWNTDLDQLTRERDDTRAQIIALEGRLRDAQDNIHIRDQILTDVNELWEIRRDAVVDSARNWVTGNIGSTDALSEAVAALDATNNRPSAVTGGLMSDLPNHVYEDAAKASLALRENGIPSYLSFRAAVESAYTAGATHMTRARELLRAQRLAGIHDYLGNNLGCAACELLDQLDAGETP